MADFIPKTDAAFASFFLELKTYVTANFAALGLSEDRSTEFQGAYVQWNTAWTAWQNMQNAYDAALAQKEATQAAGTVQIRMINAFVQANPDVTDTQREATGLPVHKTTRTAAPVPDTHPVLYRVDNEHLLQRLWFSDQNTVGKKAKPEGVAYCEIRQSLVAAGAPAPTNPDAMPYLATDSKAPHRTDLEAEDVGKTAYYCQRWVNTTQQPGPWGPITGYPVV